MRPPDLIKRGESKDARDALSRIADVLGVPIMALYDPASMPVDISRVAELIDLYLALKSESARARVLAAARAAVNAQSD